MYPTGHIAVKPSVLLNVHKKNYARAANNDVSKMIKASLQIVSIQNLYHEYSVEATSD